MHDFTQNWRHNGISLLPPSQNNSNWSKIWKKQKQKKNKQTVAGKRISMLSIV